MRNSRPRARSRSVHLLPAALAGCLLTVCWSAALAAGTHNTPSSASASSQPVRIEADHAEINRNRSTSVYTGSVKVDQGHLHLTGKRLVVTQEAGNSHFTGVMTGSPAHLVQDPSKPGQQPTYAHASQITYDSGTRVLRLKGDAHVHQGGNTLSGETITYDTQTRRIEASRSHSRQVHITIYPKSPPGQQKSQSKGSSTGSAGNTEGAP